MLHLCSVNCKTSSKHNTSMSDVWSHVVAIKLTNSLSFNSDDILHCKQHNQLVNTADTQEMFIQYSKINTLQMSRSFRKRTGRTQALALIMGFQCKTLTLYNKLISKFWYVKVLFLKSK